MQELAARKLHLIDIRATVARLQEVCDGYREQTGQEPVSIPDVLAAAGITGVSLADPLGGTFLIHDGEVLNTSLLDEIATMRMNRLQSLVNAHNRERGQYPGSLEEMVETNYVPGISPHPYPGGAWIYDPATGDVDSSIPLAHPQAKG
jgi:hypothetical protein